MARVRSAFCSGVARWVLQLQEGFSMTRVFTGTCLAVLCAAGLAAQAPTGSAEPQAQDSMKTVTVTGCLRAGEAPDTFVLSDAKLDDKGRTTPSPTGTSGTGSAAAATAAPATTVRLVGSPAGVTMTEHIGHTVEVTGVLSDAKDKGVAGTTGSGTGGDQTSRSRAGQSDKPEQTLTVRTLKTVSSSCDK
jgi:hypothetical protein